MTTAGSDHLHSQLCLLASRLLCLPADWCWVGIKAETELNSKTVKGNKKCAETSSKTWWKGE